MTDGGALLRFPAGHLPPKKPESVKASPSLPPMDSYDYEEAVELQAIASSVKKKGEEILGVIDQDRDAARKVGIEVLGVQIRSILEGEKYGMVLDALEDATYRKKQVSLTREGIDKVHRLERLVSDADTIMIQRMSGRKNQLGQAEIKPVYTNTSDSSLWIPMVVIGVAGIVGVIAILALSSNRNNQLGQALPAAPAQPAAAPVVRKAKKMRLSR